MLVSNKVGVKRLRKHLKMLLRTLYLVQLW